MSVLDLARILIYRVHEKGLEIFLIKSDMQSDPDVWKLPQGASEGLKYQLRDLGKDAITLDEVKDDSGHSVSTLAVEGDWHDIPSIRGIVKHDLKLAKKIMVERLPGSEKGAFVAAKEVFKKVLPHEYKAIKELTEIIADRNAVKNI